MSDPVKLAAAADAAVIAENDTGCPAALLLAQWALESGWGEHSPGNNCFGIKAYPDAYGRQLLHTVEYFTKKELAQFLDRDPARTATLIPSNTTHDGRDKYSVEDWFATFPTLAACFKKRAQLFFTGPYRPFAEAYALDHDLAKAIAGIAPIYATDPNYSTLLQKILHQQNFQEALTLARGDPSTIVA